DCAAMLPGVLRNIDRMAGLFGAASFLCIENDSEDATKRLLQRWCEARPTARLITRDGLGASCPVRTVRLAMLRREYVRLVSEEFADHDYLFVVDCDDGNADAIDVAAVARAVAFLARGPAR